MPRSTVAVRPHALVPKLAGFALALLATACLPARAQDAAAGGMAFLQCADCHSPGDSNGVGPGLKGVVGRAAGKQPGFAYSAALAKSTLTWDAATLDKFLAAPQKLVPGTTMTYPGDDDPKDRADLIAYLQSLK